MSSLGLFGRMATGIESVLGSIRRLPQDAPRFFRWFWMEQRHWIFLLVPFLFLTYRSLRLVWGTWFGFDSPLAIQAFVPLLAYYMGWEQRSKIATAYQEFTSMVSANSKRRRGQLWLVLLGVFVLLIASLAVVPTLAILGLVLIIAGIVYYVYGWFVCGQLAIPLGFLVLMIPPGPLLGRVSNPLQVVSTVMLAGALQPVLHGVKAIGNIIVLPNTRLIITASLAGMSVIVPIFVITIWFALRRHVRYFNYPVLLLLVLLIALLVNFGRLFLLALIINSNPSLGESIMRWNSWFLVFISLIPAYYMVNMFRPKVLSQLGEGQNTL